MRSLLAWHGDELIKSETLIYYGVCQADLLRQRQFRSQAEEEDPTCGYRRQAP